MCLIKQSECPVGHCDGSGVIVVDCGGTEEACDCPAGRELAALTEGCTDFTPLNIADIEPEDERPLAERLRALRAPLHMGLDLSDAEEGPREVFDTELIPPFDPPAERRAARRAALVEAELADPPVEVAP